MTVTAAVARAVAENSPYADRLATARGESALQDQDFVIALYLLYQRGDKEMRGTCLRTLRGMDADRLTAAVSPEDFFPRVLHFLAQIRCHDPLIFRSIIDHPSCAVETLLYLLEHAERDYLSFIFDREGLWREIPEAVEALLRNQNLSDVERSVLTRPEAATDSEPIDSESDIDDSDSIDMPINDSGESDEFDEDDFPPPDEENFSKYQLALEMGVSEKIKMALTGDKEWRSIFLKDSNKLVNTAVLKNPRITDGEVLAVCKNKTSSEELIRLVMMNKEWMKLNMIRTALVTHPKTPPPQALRFMGSLTEKQLKELSKSKGVSQIVVTGARRMLVEKAKKK